MKSYKFKEAVSFFEKVARGGVEKVRETVDSREVKKIQADTLDFVCNDLASHAKSASVSVSKKINSFAESTSSSIKAEVGKYTEPTSELNWYGRTAEALENLVDAATRARA